MLATDHPIEECVAVNVANWNERVGLHVNHGYDEKTGEAHFYDINSFRQGQCSLQSVELDEIVRPRSSSDGGPRSALDGLRLLHLQCHFGMDSLSLARLGAIVTGVDFADKAIAQAEQLRAEMGLSEAQARFIVSDVFKLPEVLKDEKGAYDVVFTSYGVLCWLRSMSEWAAVIAYFLRDGGEFYLIDDHPIASMFDEKERDDGTKEIRMSYPYCSQENAPTLEEGGYTYGSSLPLQNATKAYEWNHSLGSIVNALIQSSIQIQFIHEHPFGFWKRYSVLEKDEDGKYWFPNREVKVPLMLSLKGKKTI